MYVSSLQHVQKHLSFNQCFGSGTGSWFRGLLDSDPDPHLECGSGFRGFNKDVKCYKIILLFTTIYFSIDFLSMRKSYNYEIILYYFQMCSKIAWIRNRIQRSSGTGLRFLAVSGSGLNEYGSEILFLTLFCLYSRQVMFGIESRNFMLIVKMLQSKRKHPWQVNSKKYIF